MSGINTDSLWHLLSTQGADFGLKVLAALAAWIVGRWLIALGLKLFSSALSAAPRWMPRWLPACHPAGGAQHRPGLGIILDIFGVKTTSFAALLAGAGLAVGTAWGGMLTHFAAGVFMQLQRPSRWATTSPPAPSPAGAGRSDSSPPPWSRWRTCAPSLATTPSSMA